MITYKKRFFIPVFFTFLSLFLLLSITFVINPARASEQSLRDSLANYGLNGLTVTTSDNQVSIKYQQTIAEFSDFPEMLDRVADILEMASNELGADYKVVIDQLFDDDQIMRISSTAANGSAYLSETIGADEFLERINFQALTRGPMIIAGECDAGQGENCENCSGCACYPGEICAPDNPAANERGCVVVTVPEHAHLNGSQYVCDDGFEWNADLSNCVPLVVCPENAFKFQGECECEAGYAWNDDKTACIKVTNLYYPHLACIGGWETEICLINPSSVERLNGTLKFYSNSGREIADQQELSLAPHARYQFTLNRSSAGAAELGYIVFGSLSETMCGYLKFFLNGKYRVAIPATLDKTSNENLFVSHIASDKIWWTGISLLNTSPSGKRVTLTFNDGQTKSVTLAGNEHRAFSIASLFDAEEQPGLNSAEISGTNGIVGLQLFGGGNQLSGILLKDNTASALYYPHLVSDDTWWTGIVAYNPHLTAANLTITPYSTDGTVLNTQKFSLGSHEKYLGTLSSLSLPDESAWFKVESNVGVTGFELFGTNNGSLLAGYTGVAIASRNAIFPKLEDNGWTGIAFANISPEPANIDLTFYNDAGVAVADGKLQVDGYSKVLGSAENLLRVDTSGATYMDYSSDREVVGFQLNGSADNMMLDALPGM